MALAVGAALVLGVAGTAAAATGPGNGSAYGVQVSVLGGTIAIPATPLVVAPPGGQKSLINVGAGGLNVAALSVSSQSFTGNSASSAGLLGVTVPALLTATGVTSQCSATPTGASGSSTLVGANSPVTGPLAANPPPNTNIPIVVGSLNLNEQSGGPNSIHVRAVHVAASPITDVVLSDSQCGLSLVGAATANAASATSGAGSNMPSLAG